jgi:hypothetical protein
MSIAPGVYRAFAAILPALLAQGLIYLCVVDRIAVGTAVLCVAALAAVVVATAALARSAAEERLVREHAPPEHLRRLRTQLR